MNFNSKARHESKTCVGVAFTVRTLNQRKRAEWGLSVAEHLAEQDRLHREMNMLSDDDPKRTEYLFRWTAVNNAHIKPALIELALVSIEGVTVDGAEADLPAILESIPDDLAEEIYDACNHAAGLSEEDSKNSLSPGTSAGQTDGASEDSSAPNANA